MNRRFRRQAPCPSPTLSKNRGAFGP